MPRASTITQSVCAQNASVPSASRPSVRRRAQTLRNPVTVVETSSVVPSGTGRRIASSAARTTQVRPRAAYQSRSKPRRSEWIQATSCA